MIPDTNKQFHTHVDERGIVVRCYHECKNLLFDWRFIIGMTIGFPIEHWLWESWPLNIITHWLGL